jgi:tetratricopeptide (TPR) repeat protein
MRHTSIWMIISLIALSGCSLGLRQQWTDFNAYYNTFYNAKQGYERGIRAMDNQRATINAERPIRIHLTPVRAGQAEFERSIEKSADILRNHDDSRWVDDALELIGKSYFHLSQFFSAEQKFNEILAASVNDVSRQSAIYWRGRVYLETSRYNEGIRYLNGILISEDFNWDGQIFREIHLVLAQLHVQLENWQEADDALRVGIPGLRNEILRSRAAFLHGQVLERLNLPEQAIIAYSGLSRRYPDYQLLYLSQLKTNQLIRQIGEPERAYREFTRMIRDAKNFDQLPELNYELGRTKQVMGRFDDAFLTFEDVLYSSLQTPSRETVAKTHYAIAELYRFAYGDFRMAAVYYDSSSRAATDLSRLPITFDARELSESFGTYARLSRLVQDKDSLMWLGALPPDEFEATIRQIRDERLREYERQMRLEQLRGTTVVTITDPDEQPVTPEAARDNGFLNHRNDQLVRQASEGFAALWEGRPLVDDWRRMEGVRQAIIARDDEQGDSETELGTTSQSSTGRIPGLSDLTIPRELQIDLSIIPITEADRQKMGEEIASIEYEIGNVFYLNLAMPDSALYRYLRVVEEFPDSEVRAQAMYSIADIYIFLGQIDVATEWALAIIEEYPATIMARRISERLEIDTDLTEELISEEEVAEREYLTILASITDAEPTERIARLGSFLERFPEATQRPNAILNKAIAYAEIGRTQQNFAALFERRMQMQAEWNLLAEQFEIERVTAREMLADTTLAEYDMLHWKTMADSTLIQPDFAEYFPYVGSAWDSTRVYLQKIADNHAQSSVRERSVAMLQTVKLPTSLQRLQEPNQVADTLQIAAIPDQDRAIDGSFDSDTLRVESDTSAIAAAIRLTDTSDIVITEPSRTNQDATSLDSTIVSGYEMADQEMTEVSDSLLVASELSLPLEPMDQVDSGASETRITSDAETTSDIISESAPIIPPAERHSMFPFPDYPVLGYRIGTVISEDTLLRWDNNHRYFMQVIITTYTGASMRRNYLANLTKDSTVTLLPQYRSDLRIRWLLGSGYFRDFSHAFQAIRATGADMNKEFIELYHYIDARLFGVEPDLDPSLPTFTIRLGQFDTESEANRYLDAWYSIGMSNAIIVTIQSSDQFVPVFEIRTGKYTDRITAELLADIVYQRSGVKADVVADEDL